MNAHKGLELRGFDPSLELDLRAGEFLTHDRQFTPVPTGVGISGHEPRQGRREDLRRNVADLRLVHGHTHVPYLPEKGWPLDVGSLTFSRTYGEVVDGVPTLHFL